MNKVITCNDQNYMCICINTHVLSAKDDLLSTAQKYISPLLTPNDIVFMSEKAVACTQNRAVPMAQITPRRLAVLLSRFVYKSPYGIGLSLPETMEMALRECGTSRILLAAIASCCGKLLRQKGWFYRIAGWRAAAIDGPAAHNIPPYNNCVVLAPYAPNKTAKDLSEIMHCPVVIVDINDLGGKILGASDCKLNEALLMNILSGNPLGQSREQTPFGILRKI